MKKQSNLFAAGRKLSLSKRTISNLNSNKMNQKVGGGSGVEFTCNCTGRNATGQGHTCGNGNICYTHKC